MPRVKKVLMAAVVVPRRCLLVAAAALIDQRGRVLVQQRPPGKPMPGLWEFPGGKIDDGESPEQALVRELDEELGITVDPARLLPGPFASEPSADCNLLLVLYLCREWRGTPVARHATALAWHEPSALHRLPMPPADGPLIDRLMLFLPLVAPNPSS